MKRGKSKNITGKKDLYLTVLNALKTSTNLKNIQKELDISKQQLYYYLRRLKKTGVVHNPSHGRWELTKQSKNITKYGRLLKPDTTRGHAYIVNVNLSKIPENWNRRVLRLQKKKVRHNLVGAKKTTPRIKVLGRKVWLCNDHIRIFDKKDESYYGETAIESRKLAFLEFKRIMDCLENKLGLKLQLKDIEFRKEHYAFIKNGIAIEENKKGNILRISDEEGEWLLVDDSLGEGGELENIGKKALSTHIKQKKWWNDMKKTNFEVTPTLMMSAVTQNAQNLNDYAVHLKTHVEAIQTLSQSVKELRKEIKGLRKLNKEEK